MSGTWSDDELASLTEEERKVLVEDNAEGEAGAAEGAGAAAEAGSVEGKAAADSGAEPKAAEAGEAEGVAAEQPRDEQGRFTREPPEPIQLIRPGDVDGAKAILDAVAGKEEGLLKQFDDGEITAREYADGLRKLTAESAAATWQIQKAEIAGEISAAQRMAMEKVWFDNCDAYVADHPELVSTQLRATAFDTAVRRINSSPETSKLPQQRQLEMARELWSKELGLADYAQAQKDAANANKGKAPPARVIPPTLAKVPAADIGDAGNQYAALDELADSDPEKFQSIMDGMSEKERARYLAAA